MIYSKLAPFVARLRRTPISKTKLFLWLLVASVCLVHVAILLGLNVPYLISPAVYHPSYPLPPPNQLRPDILIAVLTFYYGINAKAIRPLVEPNKEAYAKYHGYTYISGLDKAPFLFNNFKLLGGHITGANRQFIKLVVLRHFLPYYDWVLWSDAESIFLNFSRPLTDYIDPRYDMILTSIPPGPGHEDGILNNGHILARNSKWTVNLLDEAISTAKPDCTKSRELKDKFKNAKTKWTLPQIDGRLQLCTPWGNRWEADQGPIQLFASYGDEATEKCHFKRMGFRDFNSHFPFYGDGDLIVQIPERKSRTQFDLINLLLERTNFTDGVIDKTNADALRPAYHSDHSLGLEKTFPNRPCRS